MSRWWEGSEGCSGKPGNTCSHQELKRQEGASSRASETSATLHTLISGFGRRTDFCYFKPSSLGSLDMYGCPRTVTQLPSFKYTHI